VAFLDHTINPKFSTTIGYSWQENDNTEGQAPSAFRTGHYFLGNLMFYPATGVMLGGELLYGVDSDENGVINHVAGDGSNDGSPLDAKGLLIGDYNLNGITDAG